MILYVYLFVSSVVIYCNQAGCMQVSMEHFNRLVAAGLVEMIFEMPYLVKVYKRLFPKGEEKEIGEEKEAIDG
jgi:hypothetical protein